MQYLKHYYVDSSNPSIYLTESNIAPNGKTHPLIDGLDVKIWINEPQSTVDYCLSVCPDTTTVTVVTGIEVLTFDQWADQAESHFNEVKGDSSIVMNKSSLETVMQAYYDLAVENAPDIPQP
jgi:hypothetical protein